LFEKRIAALWTVGPPARSFLQAHSFGVGRQWGGRLVDKLHFHHLGFEPPGQTAQSRLVRNGRPDRP